LATKGTKIAKAEPEPVDAKGEKIDSSAAEIMDPSLCPE
jgi:hypothetical protein